MDTNFEAVLLRKLTHNSEFFGKVKNINNSILGTIYEIPLCISYYK
jgi:hypothetical protein